MNKKKWIVYGITGVVGLGVVAGGAAAAASTMDLQTTEGTVLPGGTVTDRGTNVLDGKTVQLRQTNSSVTVISAPSAATVASVASVGSTHSVASAPSAPVDNTPASVPSPVSAPSAASIASAPSS